MEITVIDNTQTLECAVLVVNKFENELTSSNIANKYAVEEDKLHIIMEPELVVRESTRQI